jgi:hypothetical protein
MKLVYNRLMYQTEDLKIENDLVESYKAVSPPCLSSSSART